ncbi:MAG: Fe-S cluster assembly protein SufD [Bacteroidales bacterium]
MQNIDSYIQEICNNQDFKHMCTLYNSFEIPTKKMEDWKFYSAQELFDRSFEFNSPHILKQADVENVIRDIDYDSLLIFENGAFVPQFSKLTSETVTQQGVSYSVDSSYEDKLEVLNAVGAEDGAVINIGEQATKQHVYIVSFCTAHSGITMQRNVVHTAQNAHVIVTEMFVSLADEVFVNHAITIQTEEQSSCNYTSVQKLGAGSQFIQHVRINQEQHSAATFATFPLSGAYNRSQITVNKNDVYAHTYLNGVFFPEQNEQTDVYVLVNHHASDCETHKMYKGLAKDSGVGVFAGKVFVARDAQHTNATQNSKNILLSHNAKIHSKPQLEIYADDVSCSHGSTTGQIDKEALWYMQTRGIKRSAAMKLLLSGFINDVVNTIPVVSVRNYIQSVLLNKLV